MEDNRKGYFQFLMNDSTQLDSEVIRVYQTHWGMNDKPSLEDIVEGHVHFHAHVVIKLGLRMNIWTKVDNMPVVNPSIPKFRDSEDYGNPDVVVSSNWFVWEVGGEFETVGRLQGECQRYDIGVVIAPPHIVTKMNSGEYDFVYPLF